MEAPTPTLEAAAPTQATAQVQVHIPVQVSTGVQSSPIPTPTPPLPPASLQQDTSDRDEETASNPSEAPTSNRIPRAGLSKSFRRMKAFLFRKSSSPEVHRRRSNPESLEVSPDMLVDFKYN